MKFVIDVPRPHDADVVRQITVRPKQPSAIITPTLSIEMNYLPGRVNTCIGATGTGHLDRMVGNQGEGFFNALLYAQAGFLALPTVVRRTVVLNAECDAHAKVRGS